MVSTRRLLANVTERKVLIFDLGCIVQFAKGAPALECRTEGWLVSLATGAGKKKVPSRIWFQNIDLSMVEHARVCQSVVYIIRTRKND
jgi:hypothetical protein